jgi:NADPH:quinone reductase
MKAVWYEKFGEARDVLKYGDFPMPQAKPGEVLVRLSYSGVNPSDVKRRRGTGAMATSYPKVIPHNDGSGIIESAGDGSLSRVGERVWIYEAQINRPLGTAAEYAVVPKELAVPLARKADMAFAASLGVPAMTAHRCVFSGGPVKNQTILVSGGAGSVGNFAIQLAKWGGAQVVTTVSSKEKGDVALKAHADHVINYKEENVVSRVMEITGGKGLDRVVEVSLGTNLAEDIQMMKPNGVIAAYASDAVREPVFPFYTLFQKNIQVYCMLVYTMGREAHLAALTDISSCLEQGVFVPNLGKTYPLTETVKAHEDVESGKSIGKVLVKI